MTAGNPKAPLTDDAALQRLVGSLKARNVEAFVAPGGEAAQEMLVKLVPPGAELYKGTSETLDAIGYTQYLQQTDRYRYLNREVSAEADPEKQRDLRRRLSSVAQYYVGSVHAIAQTGEVVVASGGSGSQLAAYVYGAQHVIWVAGAQKVCPSLDDALARVRGYALERHDQWLADRGRSASPLGKLMVFEHEQVPGRVQMIVIKQSVGW